MQVVQELEAMSEERFGALYEALSQQGFGPLDREVAQALRFRPQAIRKLSMAQRAKKARAIVLRAHNAELAYELLGSYLMKESKELITDFLDQVGIAHEEGMIENIDEAVPDPAKLEAAIAALDEKYPAEDVTLYLAMCATQWPDAAEIDAAWQARRPGVES